MRKRGSIYFMQQFLDNEQFAISLASFPDGRVMMINETFLAIIGYSRHEVIGRTSKELRLWACPEEHAALMARLAAHGRVENCMMDLCRKDGKIVTCRCLMQYMVDANGQKLLAGFGYEGIACHDREPVFRQPGVSARAKAHRYQDIVENAQVIIMNLDKTGHVLFINEFGAGLFGYCSSEVNGRLFTDMLLPEFESTGRNLRTFYKEMLANPETHAQFAGEVVKKDGRRLWIEWANRLIQDADSGETSVVAVGVDATERRRLAAWTRKKSERRRQYLLLDDVIHNRISEEEFFTAEKAAFPLTAPLVCMAVDFGCSRACLQRDENEWQVWIETAADLIYSKQGGFVWQAEPGLVVVLQSVFQAGCAKSGLTLKEIVSGASMKEMAARLHIHPKTLAFRKLKIQRLLKVKIDDPEERLNIAIALKMNQLRESFNV